MTEKRHEREPLDSNDDLYSALAASEGPWFMQGEDDELVPISREQIAQALALRRRLAQRDRARDHPGGE